MTLLVKFAELLLTHEHRIHLPAEGFVWRHLAQVWLSLRFSWQDFAVAGTLFAGLSLASPFESRPWAHRVFVVTHWGLGVLTPLTALGIGYYAIYQSHISTTDFAYIRFAPQLLATAEAERFRARLRRRP